MTVSATSLLGGRYRLEERVAVGGMGEVWRGHDTVLDRPVAVKLPAPGYAHDPAFRRRFLQEARHAAAVGHPNIANVFDFGEGTGEEPPYLVMELVDGEPLSASLARDGALPPALVAELVAEVATALQAAHASGLVHRDVKPGNLLICSDGRVKVTDFGIARATDEAGATSTAALLGTAAGAGALIGTAPYLSPEQVDGRAATPASDLYSLGVVAYECLTGRRPFDGEPIAVALAHRSQPPPPLPAAIPLPMIKLVDRLLAKDPAQRPSSARAVADQARRLARDLRALDPTDRAGTGVPEIPEASRGWGGRKGSRGWGGRKALGATGASAPGAAGSWAATTMALAPPGAAATAQRSGAGEQLVLAPPGAAATEVVALPIPSPRRPRRLREAADGRGVGITAALLTLAALLAVGLVAMGANARSPARKPAGVPRVATPIRPAVKSTTTVVHPVAASLFEPNGGSDDPQGVGYAYDGNLATAWQTDWYLSPAFGNLKRGVGLVFNLGRPVDVREVRIVLLDAGAGVNLYAGNSPSDLLNASLVASWPTTPANVVAMPATGVRAQYWLVFFTRLPPIGGGRFQSGLREVSFAAAG